MFQVTFVVHVGSDEGYKEEFHKYFLSSPLFHSDHGFQILVQRGFKSAGQAFNDAIEKAANDVLVFPHLDVVFPAMWAQRFLQKLAEVESGYRRVGVVGSIGITAEGKLAGHIYRHDREVRSLCPLPSTVETVEPVVICMRKSSGLRFDPAVPSFFGYGTDICLEASARGLHNFVVDAPCFHQGKDKQGLGPREAFESVGYLIEKWRHVLPVRTLAGTIHRKPSYLADRIKQSVFRLLGYSPTPWWKDLPRINPEEVLLAGLPEKQKNVSKPNNSVAIRAFSDSAIKRTQT